MKPVNTLTKLGLLAAVAILTQACATKGAKQLTAYPLPGPTKGPENWAVEDAPRQRPGALMDPDATTYAQIPSRIIYLPGGGGIFGRQSGSQQVAYNLIPVSRIPEVQAKGTPTMETRSVVKETTKPPASSFGASFPDKDGNEVKGTARRLGVLGKTDVEKTRAQSLLGRGEGLQWSPDIGWVGFTEEIVVRPIENPKKTVAIPEIPEMDNTKPAQMEAPNAIPLDEKKEPETTNSQENKEGTPVKEGKSEDKPIKLNKSLGLELSFDE